MQASVLISLSIFCNFRHSRKFYFNGNIHRETKWLSTFIISLLLVFTARVPQAMKQLNSCVMKLNLRQSNSVYVMDLKFSSPKF